VLLGTYTLYQAEVTIVSFSGYLLRSIMAAFLIHPRAAPVVGGLGMVLMTVTGVRIGETGQEMLVALIGGLCIMALSFIVHLFAKEV